MGLRGKVPPGRKNILTFPSQDAGTRPNPPSGLTARSRALFKKIVASKPAGTYTPEAVVLLRGFCDAEDSHNTASKMLAKQGAVVNVDTRHGMVPRRNPWFDIKKESAASMKALSAHLRRVTSGKRPAPTTPPGRVMFKPHTD